MRFAHFALLGLWHTNTAHISTQPAITIKQVTPNVARHLSQMIVHIVAFPSSSASLGILLSPPPGVLDAIDDRVRDALQRTSHDFFIWVLASAFAVAVGVALEGPEILHELWPKLFSWFTWQSHKRLEKFERGIRRVGLIGWLLVVIGVAGEGIFEGLQNRAEGQLQTFNEIQLKHARLSAAEANERASKNEAAAAQLQIDSLKLGVELQKAKEGVANANQKAANASKEAEEERIERLRLEMQISPRRLTDSQRLALSLTCPIFPFRRVAIVSYALDAEAAILANQIGKSLECKNGLLLENRVASMMPLGGFTTGIQVSGTDETLVARLKDGLSSLITDASPVGNLGMSVGVGNASETAIPSATITIGVKPPKQ